MAIDNPEFAVGQQASGDLSSDQYKLVERSGTNQRVSVCNAATDIPVGVLYNKPDAAGKGADVAVFRVGTIVKIKVGSGGVSAGDFVGTNASGLLTTKATTGQFAVGYVDKAWAENDYAEVRCMPRYIP